MGLDPGEKRIGVALSDPSGLIAQSLTVIQRTGLNRDLHVIADLAKDHEVERIVVGLPRRLDGSLGPAAKQAEQFARQVERLVCLPVVLWDERLTTVAAQKAMIEAGVRREKRREKIDAVAAAILLQGYLDFSNREAGPD
jgi:putative Holliday junction resolvase